MPLGNLGQSAERHAVHYLENLSFSIITRNYHAGRLGEIDIIAEKNRTLHFVEVKARQYSLRSAAQAVSPTKLRKLVLSSQHFLRHSRYQDSEWQIDLLCILQKQSVRTFLLIENITM